MKQFLRAVGQLAPWQKVVIGAMGGLILLTWLAVCLVLTGFLAP
jgi:hypothetical protein